uniref:Uncharacterized protein n=1 Tax=Xenopus tropicalis TaxID=8364 RepID=A0A1B8Y2S2_XENTR
MHLQTTMLQNELPTRSIKRHVCITNTQKPVVCRAETHKLNPIVMNKGIFLAFHWRQGTEREWLSPFEQ